MFSFLRYIIFTTVFFLLVIQWFSAVAQQIAINEFMASNSMAIADEDGDFEDWIEIYNPGEQPLDLKGFGLSDDYDDPFKWVFPDKTIIPGQFILVWASGKDRANLFTPLHTNFCIDNSGEEILLTHPSGTRMDEVQPLALPTDISYGRIPDGADQWYYFDEPTPGNSNTTQGYSEILDPPAFSHPGGFYSDGFYLTISHADPDAVIIYTLDGSVPDSANLNAVTFQYKNSYPFYPGDPFGELLTSSYSSYHYSDSLLIDNRSDDPDSLTCFSSTFDVSPNYIPENPVFKGTVVRAKAFKTGALSSKVKTSTYFVDGTGRQRYSLPVISINLGKNELFDYEDGIYTAGTDYDTWRLNNPDAPHNWLTQANFHRKGVMWEKPAHFEFFEADSTFPQNSLDIGIRIHGSEARRRPMKSIRLYARNHYGESHFNHQFFEEIPDEMFKRLVMRNSGQDYLRTMLRDAFLQTIVKDLNFDTQEYRPAIVFLNGEYWGIHNLRERYDKFYFQRVYGVDPENIDHITNLNEVGEGDMVHYNETIGYIEEHGLVDDEHFQYIQTRIDIENFRDYQIANIYMDNYDWPGNNNDYWRLRTTEYQPDAPYGNDGRWRWALYDTDFGFGLFDPDSAVMHNMLEFATATGGTEWPNPEWSTFLLRKFLENDFFKNSFINRFADLLNTIFLPGHVIGTLEQLKQVIEPEMPEHIARWKNLYNMGDWHAKLAVLSNFAELRPEYQRQHITDYFELPGVSTVVVDVSNHWHGHIRVNTIELTDETPGVGQSVYPWSGFYFKEVPVELEAKPAHGYAFSHWEGDVTGTDAIVTIQPENEFFAKAHFVRDNSPKLIHYWLFDESMPNDTPFDSLDATYAFDENGVLIFYSALAGYPFDPEHPSWRKASMERRNKPTPLNYRPEGNNNIPYDDSGMRGLQIRQPFTGDGGENTLVFEVPAINFQDLIFRFAAMDENAAGELLIDYSVAEQEPVWLSDGLTNPSPELFDNYQLYEIDFSNIDPVNDNPHFRIRIRFDGEDMGADEGNRVTFNNFSLDGVLVSGVNLPPEVAEPIPLQNAIEQDNPVEIDLHNVFMDPDNDSLTFAAMSNRPEMADVNVNGSLLTIIPEKRGDAVIKVSASDEVNDPVDTEFRVMIYPKAFPLNNNAYYFDAWQPDEPEYKYPENVLFVQSNTSDPGIYDQMSYPYFIPHDDYHEDDQFTVGFPYNNTRRSRINGLGESGISFINTGRDRDPGGLLLALDTRGVAGATLSWLTETMQQNERKYALGLFYRTDINAPFNALIVNNQPVNYLSGETGDMGLFNDLYLPPYIFEEPYIQLLWKYYHVEGSSGTRAELRLDGIEIKDITTIPDTPLPEILIYGYGDDIFFRLPEIMQGTITVFDISGQKIKKTNIKNSTRFSINLYPYTGIFIVRMITDEHVFFEKLMLN
jgi:hypothetical protein